jgi:AGZA family xanthine/uracil permease-like MFS transporter
LRLAHAVAFAPLAVVSVCLAPAVIEELMFRGIIQGRLAGLVGRNEALPAFAAMTVMPFTYSISNGLVAGFVSYAAVKLLAGRGREVHWIVYLLAGIFVAGFAALKLAP